MLLPIPYDRLTPSRIPWMSIGVAALWVAVFAASSLGVPDVAWETLALEADPVEPAALAAHWLLHESAAHLISGLALLLVLGPVLEEAWGRPFFGAFLVGMVLYTSGTHVVTAGADARPLVGATAVLAALLGACIGRHLREGIQFTAVGWWGRPVHAELQVPAYALLALWFVAEVAMQVADDGAGPSRGASYAGQATGAMLGAAVALLLRQRGLEARWLKRTSVDAPHPALAEAELALASGGAAGGQTALRLLAPAVRRAPDDTALMGALCRAAAAAREPEAARAPLLAWVGRRLAAGEGQLAARLWSEHAKPLGRPQPEPRVALALAESLARHGHGLEAARLVRGLLERPRRVTTGMALRLVDIARPVHAGLALRAARLALEGGEFAEEKRRRLETTLRELEVLQSERLDPQLDEGPARPEDRSIAIAEEDDLHRPPPAARRPAAAPPLPEERDDSLFDLGGAVDLSAPDPESTPAPAAVAIGLDTTADEPRFGSAKRVDVLPVAWEGTRLSLRQGDGAPAWLDLAKVEAVAAAAVHGLAPKPVVLIDLLTNWSGIDDVPLRVLRLRSDRFDPGALLPGAGAGLDAFRAVIDALITRSGGTPLPDPERARGRPFAIFRDLASYEREVLKLDA